MQASRPLSEVLEVVLEDEEAGGKPRIKNCSFIFKFSSFCFIFFEILNRLACMQASRRPLSEVLEVVLEDEEAGGKPRIRQRARGAGFTTDYPNTGEIVKVMMMMIMRMVMVRMRTRMVFMMRRRRRRMMMMVMMTRQHHASFHPRCLSEAQYILVPGQRIPTVTEAERRRVGMGWQTMDGGKTWTQLLYADDGYYFNGIHCISDLSCTAVAEGHGDTNYGSRVFRTGERMMMMMTMMMI
jgi:hypothetical protein